MTTPFFENSKTFCIEIMIMETKIAESTISKMQTLVLFFRFQLSNNVIDQNQKMILENSLF